MKRVELKANVVISGPLFPEPVQVVMTQEMGAVIKVIGKGLRTEKFYDSIITEAQLETITASPEREPFDGDPIRFRLGIEGMRLGLAYEYDPYFSLSIARVDPLRTLCSDTTRRSTCGASKRRSLRFLILSQER